MSLQRAVATLLGPFLDALEIGPADHHHGLTIWPLVLSASAAASGYASLGYEPLWTAMQRGQAHVSELDVEASVPHVRVRNDADVALLVLFGEELIGARQNRIANASFLVPPRDEAVIDVTCVEAGRWSHHAHRATARFERADSLIAHSIRRRMASQVYFSRSVGRGYRSDQSDVWRQVAERLDGWNVVSPSHAYADYRRTQADDLQRVRAAFSARERQVGFVAAIDEEIVGMEAFGRPEVFAACLGRMLDAYAADALEAERARESGADPRPGPAEGPSPAALLGALKQAHADAAASPGMGEDLRLHSADVEGSALVAGEIVHLSAAPRLA